MKKTNNIENYSLSRKLKREGKTTEEFEIIFNSLSLEEIIGLKLELASKLFGNKLYGMPIWRSTKEIVQSAMIKYIISASKTKSQAARFLGLDTKDFRTYVKKYNEESYFEGESDNAN